MKGGKTLPPPVVKRKPKSTRSLDLLCALAASEMEKTPGSMSPEMTPGQKQSFIPGAVTVIPNAWLLPTIGNASPSVLPAAPILPLYYSSYSPSVVRELQYTVTTQQGH